MASPTPTPDLDRWTQNIYLIDGHGDNVTLSMKDMDAYRLFGFRLAINYGCQVGASIMLLLVLLLLTRAEKRKSYIFVLNASCLFLNTIRCILLCTWVTSGYNNPYSLLVEDYSRITSGDKATQVAQHIITALVTIMVLVSLCSQVWIVCVTTPPLQRNIIMGVTSTIGCVALGYRLAAVYFDTKTSLASQSMDSYLEVVAITYVLQAVSIWVFSCVFICKLGHAMWKRHRLNMPQFGPMQVVFIMGCQTMLVPGTFAHRHTRADS
jgi:pheromone alpha factor receptor